MIRLRILVLGPDCDPERVSIPFVTYSHAAALAELHDPLPWSRERRLKALCAGRMRHFVTSRWSACLGLSASMRGVFDGSSERTSLIRR